MFSNLVFLLMFGFLNISVAQTQKTTSIVVKQDTTKVETLHEIPKEEVRQTIRKQIKDIGKCFEKMKSKSEHKVVIDFEVNDQGQVFQTAMNDKTTLKEKEPLTCLQDLIVASKFPPASKGQVYKVSFPFLFVKNKSK